jgi:hypothetical protein
MRRAARGPCPAVSWRSVRAGAGALIGYGALQWLGRSYGSTVPDVA